MGCIISKNRRSSAYAMSDFTELAEPETKTEGAASDKTKGTSVQNVMASSHISNVPTPQLDPKDFRFANCKDEVKIKLPGSINGQSFNIENCENCDIYILDYCSQVMIDDSKCCRIFIGPTDGSVFIRDCSDCSLAVVCRQLRTRDCTNCRVSLHCRTKPIVESSVGMGFSCFDLPYTGMAEHMRLAKLGPFHNFWSDIFDFTPKDGNWHILAPDTTAASLLGPPPAEVSELFAAGPGAEAEQPAAQSPVVKSLGVRQASPQGSSCLFVAFSSSKHEQALQLARSVGDKGWLLRTNEAKLSAAAAAALAAEAGWDKAAVKELTTPQGTAGCVGLALAVPEAAVGDLQARVKELGGRSSSSEAAAKTFRFMGLDG